MNKDYYVKDLHKDCLLHVCLIFDTELKAWEPEERKRCLEPVTSLLKRFIGKPGYYKIMDFYYNLLFWVLQNSKEKEYVLAPILKFLLEALVERTDMISRKDRFYKFVEICNQTIDLSR